VYTPLLVEEAGEAFELLFVLRALGGGMRSLCRFRWPSRDVVELERYADLRLAGVAPVPQASFR
jgi:hypothetical protein